MTQQERWGLNHRIIAERILVEVDANNTIENREKVMDALDYVWKQGQTAGQLNP